MEFSKLLIYDPLKQGLKLKDNEVFKPFYVLLIYDPLKQGLKL